MRVKRSALSAGLNDLARPRPWSSIRRSKHSAVEESVTDDLSFLVDCFLDEETRRREEDGFDDDDEEEEEEDRRSEGEIGARLGPLAGARRVEARETLMRLLAGVGDDAEGDGGARRRIRMEIDVAVSWFAPGKGFKSELVSSLRRRGFDAGLCKTRWEKTSQRPAGEHEYVDIMVSRTRYVVEVSLSTEFTIARPTSHYGSLMGLFPEVAVLTEGELKQVVRIMCGAMRDSIRNGRLHLPPWRRYGYMLGKWFGPCKRTTNSVVPAPATKVSCRANDFSGTSLVGFEAINSAAECCQCFCKGENAPWLRSRSRLGLISSLLE